MVVVNLNNTWFVKKNIAACLAGFLFGSQDIARKTRMNLKETTTMLWVFFPSFLYRICFILYLLCYLIFSMLVLAHGLYASFFCIFLHFFSIKFITYQKKKKSMKLLLLLLLLLEFSVKCQICRHFCILMKMKPLLNDK